MSRILLDSTVIIGALRGQESAARLLELRRRNVSLWVCVISVEEIWRGVRSGEEVATRRLFNGLRLAPLGINEGIQAAAWRRNFSKQGVILHQADCLIAAAAVGIGAPLATANISDFPMPELLVDHWPV